MAVLRINIPDDKLPKIVTAFCKKYNYQDMIPPPGLVGKWIQNPQSKAAFTTAKIESYIRGVYIEVESTLSIANLTSAAASTATVEMNEVVID